MYCCVVVVVVLTLTRIINLRSHSWSVFSSFIIKSVDTGQAPVTLELRNTVYLVPGT